MIESPRADAGGQMPKGNNTTLATDHTATVRQKRHANDQSRSPLRTNALLAMWDPSHAQATMLSRLPTTYMTVSDATGVKRPTIMMAGSPIIIANHVNRPSPKQPVVSSKPAPEQLS